MSPTNNKTEKDNAPKSKPNIILTLFILCIAFVVPVGLWFSVVYSEGGGIANLFFIFAGVYGFTLLTTLMFYRMGIQGD